MSLLDERFPIRGEDLAVVSYVEVPVPLIETPDTKGMLRIALLPKDLPATRYRWLQQPHFLDTLTNDNYPTAPHA